MSPTISPRTAIVTGGASGIGAAIAHRLASDGHRVATLDITPAEGGVFYEIDVTDRAQVDTALAGIHSKFGPVTILVNAAGAEGSPGSSTSPSPNGSASSMSPLTASSTPFRQFCPTCSRLVGGASSTSRRPALTVAHP
jgi:NAD(P)-dependent dehydrogenase (short-subunit alcohol dehydrogenase family)